MLVLLLEGNTRAPLFPANLSMPPQNLCHKIGCAGVILSDWLPPTIVQCQQAHAPLKGLQGRLVAMVGVPELGDHEDFITGHTTIADGSACATTHHPAHVSETLRRELR